MRQYVAYAKLITSTIRRRSDGTLLDGMVFPGGAVAVVGAVSRSVIQWAGLILPDCALLSG